MKSTVNPNRYVPFYMNAHIDCMELGNCEIFYTTVAASGKWGAIAYMGKSKNHSWHYNFKSEERMNEYIKKYIDERKLMENNKKLRKEEQKKRNASVSVEVGQIFHYSWGYEQTNCEFFQVVAVKGKTATLRAIGAKVVKGSSGFMSCRLSPIKDSFLTGNFEETITKRVKASYDNTPTFSMECGSISLTSEDSSHYSSWYA